MVSDDVLTVTTEGETLSLRRQVNTAAGPAVADAAIDAPMDSDELGPTSE